MKTNNPCPNVGANFFFSPHCSQIAVPVATTVTTKLSERKDIGKEAAIEAEVRAARERALVPLETRVISFKEMLKEKDVSGPRNFERYSN